MRMPGGAGTRLEGDACAANTCRFWCFEQRINANSTGKPIGWSFGGTLRTRSFYFHLRSPIFSPLLALSSWLRVDMPLRFISIYQFDRLLVARHFFVSSSTATSLSAVIC